MNCQDFSLEYLQSHGSLSAPAQEHLLSCQDCQAFLQIDSILQHPRPTPELDRQTLLKVSAAMQQPQKRWWQEINTYLYAVAASLLILLGFFAVLRPSAKAPELLSQSSVNSNISNDLLILSYLETINEIDNLEQQIYLYAGN